MAYDDATEFYRHGTIAALPLPQTSLLDHRQFSMSYQDDKQYIYNSTNSSAIRSIVGKADKPLSGISIYSHEDKLLFSP
jgi:hypothetical protein